MTECYFLWRSYFILFAREHNKRTDILCEQNHWIDTGHTIGRSVNQKGEKKMSFSNFISNSNFWLIYAFFQRIESPEKKNFAKSNFIYGNPAIERDQQGTRFRIRKFTRLSNQYLRLIFRRKTRLATMHIQNQRSMTCLQAQRHCLLGFA